MSKIAPSLTVLIPFVEEWESVRQQLSHWKGQVSLSDVKCDVRFISVGNLCSEELRIQIQKDFSFFETNEVWPVSRVFQHFLDPVENQFTLLLPVDCIFDPVDWFLEVRTEEAFDYYFSTKKYEPTNLAMNIYLFIQNFVYHRWLKQCVWTNGIILSPKAARTIKIYRHGFLDDLELSRELAQKLKSRVLMRPIIVSSKRYMKTGSLKQIFRNLWILFQWYFLKRSPETLKKQYK